MSCRPRNAQASSPLTKTRASSIARSRGPCLGECLASRHLNPHPQPAPVETGVPLYRYLADGVSTTAGPRGFGSTRALQKESSTPPPFGRCGRIIQRHGHARHILLIQSPSYSIFYHAETSPAASSSLICSALPELGCRRSLLLFRLTSPVSGCWVPDPLIDGRHSFAELLLRHFFCISLTLFNTADLSQIRGKRESRPYLDSRRRNLLAR